MHTRNVWMLFVWITLVYCRSYAYQKKIYFLFRFQCHSYFFRAYQLELWYQDYWLPVFIKFGACAACGSKEKHEQKRFYLWFTHIRMWSVTVATKHTKQYCAFGGPVKTVHFICVAKFINILVQLLINWMMPYSLCRRVAKFVFVFFFSFPICEKWRKTTIGSHKLKFTGTIAKWANLIVVVFSLRLVSM